MEVRIGDFIKEHLENIEKYCEENDNELKNLMDRKYTKEYLGLVANFPFLKLSQEANHNYWVLELNIKGERYRACSQFGGNDLRDGRSRSEREGEVFLKYLKDKQLLLDKYIDDKPKFIVGLENNGDENMTEDEFRQNYTEFVQSLPLQGSGQYAKLFTEARNTPFKVNRNGASSIVIKAFTDREAPMVITVNQLSKVIFKNDDYLYASYEPVLIQRIQNTEFIHETEIESEENTVLMINHIKNIILYGSPGVGKTHNTNKLINLIENGVSEKNIFKTIKENEVAEYEEIDFKERVKFITFHQSFGYEDFIEGFRPNAEGSIELVDGVLKIICDYARNDRENNHYLVIDEINRGNISKIFGELITLIEEDKRDTLEVILPYSKQTFKIPSNLYIIGTMNSTDKSIALIDIALRRRFTFLKMEPKVELISHVEAKEKFIALNENISDTLGSDYQIGHSYFMKIQNDDDLDFVWEYKIMPLLEEYYYGDEEGLKSIIEIYENN